MKLFYLKSLFLLLFVLTGATASADKVCIDGIYYNLYQNNHTAAVTSDHYNNYTGDVVIPSSINYNGETYNVTSIGWEYDHPFSGCSGLTSVSIPSSVTSIGKYAFSGCDNLAKVVLNSNHIASVNRTTSTSLKSIFGENVKEYVLGDDVTNIGSYAFYDCSNLTNVDISESVTRISYRSFYRCSGLANVIIPNGVNIIEEEAFAFCGGLKNVTIGNGVTTLKQRAFNRCTDLTTVTMGNGVTTIEDYAFMDCSKITKVITHDIAAWCSIQFNNILSNPLYYAKHLYSDEDTEISELIIPDGVTSINNFAFNNCSGLINVSISEGVTSIGGSAFNGCSGLTNVTISEGVDTIDARAFEGCSGLTCITIPSSVTSLGESAFMDCGLIKVILNSNHVVSKNYSEKDKQFRGIFGQVKEYVLGDGIIGIGSYAFWASGVENISLPNSLISIGNYAFYYNPSLSNIIIPEGVSYIGMGAFSGCSSITSVNIPSNVNTIGEGAFYECRISTITIPDNVIYIGERALHMRYGSYNYAPVSEILVNKGTTSLLALWSAGYLPKDRNTKDELTAPFLTTEATQTTMSVTVENYYGDYAYSATYTYPYRETWQGTRTYQRTVDMPEGKVLIEGLFPDFCPELSVTISKEEATFSILSDYKTQTIGPVIIDSLTSTSLYANCTRIEGDAVVDSVTILFNGEEIYSDSIELHGLDPNQSYGLLSYGVRVVYGNDRDAKRWYWAEKNLSTPALSLTTLAPKVISAGNVIVSAETNIDDEETNVGFEWRRTDWTDEFQSKTGSAALFEGTMEGFIRSLYTEKLWKYRPYYLSNSGIYHYGDWVGIDPTDVSYFEPSVHTYNTIGIEGNAALVKGYALGGTDGIKVKGFKYWPTVYGSRAMTERARAATAVGGNETCTYSEDELDVPDEAMTLTVKGSAQVMNGELKDLEYETEYCYVSFVETNEGELFYGEPRVFTTGEDPTKVKGDVNGDRLVDHADLSLLLRVIAGTAQSDTADVNRDGKVDVADVITLLGVIKK